MDVLFWVDYHLFRYWWPTYLLGKHFHLWF